VRTLGELEAVVMDRLWRWARPSTVREVLEDLRRERRVAYTTVMTVMDNLHRKGLLSRVLDARAYRYTPVRTRAEHGADLIGEVLASAEDRTAPLLHFVERMTPQEVDKLRAALHKVDDEEGRRAGRLTRRPGRR
jgi:predicted transcriptional regulator